MATAFNTIDQQYIPIHKLTHLGTFPSIVALIVRVSLKNITTAIDRDVQRNRADLWTVNLDVITERQMMNWLSDKRAFGLVSPCKIRRSDIDNCSLVQFWARVVSTTLEIQADSFWLSSLQIYVTGCVTDVPMVA